MDRRAFLDTSARLAIASTISTQAFPAFNRRSERAQKPYLDAHVHPSSPALVAYQRMNGGRGGTAVDGAALVRRMDADGVQRAFALSTAYQMASDVNRRGPVSEIEEHARVVLDNDFTAEECARYPDRLVPFLSVNPKRGYAIEEIDRCVERLKMRGLKLHLWNSMVDTRNDSDLASLKRVVGHAADRGLPVVAHIFVGAVPNYGGDDTERFVREVIAPFDKLKISVAHLAGAGQFAAQPQECFERLITLCGPGTKLASRVWTDMAAILMPATPVVDVARFAELAPRWGYERLLWGSDNIDGALAQRERVWPLDEAAWRAIASNRGDGLLS